MSEAIPTIILGGTGYVAGEFTRLIASHSQLQLAKIISNSSAGEAVANLFPHLAPVVGDTTFRPLEEALSLIREQPRSVLLAATPHGATAPLVSEALSAAEQASNELTVIDASADFRFPDADQFAAVYGQPHGAPHRLDEFFSGIPEHHPEVAPKHAAQPGCFATAMLLGIVPLLRAGIVEPNFSVAAVTGSTGSGRTVKATTHHPVRHGNLFAYKALSHRHAPEVIHHAEIASGIKPALHFIPHSGPFARGIHATIQATTRGTVTDEVLQEAFHTAYRSTPFVRVNPNPPQLKNVVGSNYAEVFATTTGDHVAVMVVIDNLIKGAAGGALQWLNRCLGFPETEGLQQPAVGLT